MQRVFIVGGAGKIGRLLATELLQRDQQPFSLCRTKIQADELQALGAVPVMGDLLETNIAQMASKMEGCDAVVFAAGAGGKGGEEMTNAIDGDGLALSVAAARRAGIPRFVLVSAFPESGRGREVSPTFENYMKVKKQADVHLASSDLDWVIVRPGTLTDHPASGMIDAGPALPYSTVSRGDVAATLAEVVNTPQISRMIIELTQGGSSVKDAIQQLIRNK